jgi:hypothetical protein
MATLIFKIRHTSAVAYLVTTTKHAAIALAIRADRATASAIVDAATTAVMASTAVDIATIGTVQTLYNYSCIHCATVI